MRKVWPALILIGGYDQGLRMGSDCVEIQGHRRKGKVMGSDIENSDRISVMWYDADNHPGAHALVNINLASSYLSNIYYIYIYTLINGISTFISTMHKYAIFSTTDTRLVKYKSILCNRSWRRSFP